MRKIFYVTGVVMISLFQFNCDGSFTREIELDSTGFEARGVVLSFLTNTDERDSAFKAYSFPLGKDGVEFNNRIFISNSMPIKHARNTFYGADVILSSGGQELPLSFYDQDQLQNNSNPFYKVSGTIRPGSSYHLSAVFDADRGDQFLLKWPPVSAKDSMPEPVPFLLEDADLEFTMDEASPVSGYIDVKIEDEPGRNNLYQVEISAIPGYNSDPAWSVIENPGNRVNTEIFGSYPNDLFEEIDFTKDGRKRIYFHINDQQDAFKVDTPVLLLVRLTNLSDNYIRFMRSSRQYYANQDNPFSEPVEIYTNVKNGFGIFALAARSYGEITVK